MKSGKKPKIKKSAVKKVAVKKVSAKKPAAKKITAKKPVLKKVSAKKISFKKATVKKAIPKKTIKKPVVKKPVAQIPVMKQVKKCKKSLCKEPEFANGYCRYHYIANWKAEHIDKRIKKIKYLEKLVAEIKRRFPAQYLELIKGDLASDKIFRQVLKDMDIEEEISDFEISDDTQKIINSYSSLVDTDEENEEF